MATPITPVYAQLERQYADPIDSTEVHASEQDAINYAASYPTAYAGQTIKWRDANGVYVSGVIQSNGTINKSDVAEFEGVHNDLTGREADDAHPTSAITDLDTYIDEYIYLEDNEPNPEFTKVWLPLISD